MGDQIKMVDFFKKQEREVQNQEKVAKLKTLLQERKRKNNRNNVLEENGHHKKAKQDLRFEFGWKHWDAKFSKYKLKRVSQVHTHYCLRFIILVLIVTIATDIGEVKKKTEKKNKLSE